MDTPGPVAENHVEGPRTLFCVCFRLMRSILIDYARAKQKKRRRAYPRFD